MFKLIYHNLLLEEVDNTSAVEMIFQRLKFLHIVGFLKRYLALPLEKIKFPHNF